MSIEKQRPYINSFIIEDGYNTSYITSLFTALYYKNSCIEATLSKDTNNIAFIYLQELIKTKFVDPMRKCYTVPLSSINEIRNYSMINGWDVDFRNIGSFLCEKNVVDFYDFLSSSFINQPIEIEKISDDIKIIKEKYNYIVLNNIFANDSYDSCDNTRDLFIQWLNNNLIYFKDIEIKKYNYKLNNVPNFIPLVINRFDKMGNKTYKKIDIMERFMFKDISDVSQKLIKWNIQSIICEIEIDGKSHYITYSKTNDKIWVVIDDFKIPSVVCIDINDCKIKEMITTQSVMVFYSFD